MDSLTQIVLGAACGEAVLGKKIGNKALLFGAIGGTIPDLDVFVGRWLYQNEIDIMLFHRGFMHSILFSVLGTFVFGWLTYKLYNTGKRLDSTTQSDWFKLYFWSLFTHPILDAFTGYGTQLFAPFSDYRVAFDNISVVDVFYTVPFLLCLIVLMFFKRINPKRKRWLKAGFIISSVYMLFTIGNKLYVDSVFKESLNDTNISYNRFQTQPSLFANFLWYGTVETEDSYYLAFFSIFDTEHKITEWQKIEKQHAIISPKDKDIKNLIWFSDGYYNLYKTEHPSEFIYTDLRYPLMDVKDERSSVFSFKIFKDQNRWNMIPFEPQIEENNQTIIEVFRPMFERMFGV